jgi:LuxR family maltose regulon positive regulatory protein
MPQREPAITPASFATFGTLLRYLRQRVLLSRAELARAAGYSESQIARLELDQRRPDVTTVQARFVPALGLDAEPAWVERLIALARPTAGAHPNAAAPAVQLPADRDMAAQPSAIGELASDLLATKLFVPHPRPNAVPRSQLLPQLDRALSVPLTLVVAPAGFGKTTLLAEWLKQNDERGTMSDEANSHRSSFIAHRFKAAWLSLDAGDNDLATFVRYLVAACQQLAAAAGQTTLALLQQPGLLPPAALLSPLVNDLATLPDTSVLVLDDTHALAAPIIQTALAFLVEYLPPRLHLILASREDPPLPLPRLRGRGQILELRARDLRFSLAESVVFLRDSMGVALTEAQVMTLNARTEGWAAGLQLAALALHDRADQASFVAALSGSQRYLGDYLAGEVLDRLPAHLKTFVLQTAILERMCGPLCDAVLGITMNDERRTMSRATSDAVSSLIADRSSFGESYSQLVLAELERRQLFLVPLDDERRWYRYHHLFADLLRARLREGGSADGVAALHRRASAWYAGQRLVVEAVQHALAGVDWQTAARLVKKHGMLLIQTGQVHTVLGWLNALPAVVVQLSPTLCQIHALGLLFTNQFDASEVWLEAAERAIQPDMPADRVRRMRAIVAMVRGGIRYYTGDLAPAISLMQQALALLSEPTGSVAASAANTRSRAVAARYAATVYQLTGDVTAASERQAADTIAPARATGYTTEMLRSYTALAALQVLQGRLRTAAATYAEVERLVPGQDALLSLIGSPSYYFGMGDLLCEWNDLDTAAGYLARGMELVQATLTDDADGILRGYLALARLQQARGNGAAALTALDAFLQLARERQLFHLLIERAMAMQARLKLLQGDLPAALRWAEGSGLAVDDELYFPREAAYLTLARLRIAAGQAEEIVPLLDRLLVDARAKARMHSAIEILTLQALAYNARDDRPRALATLEQALALAEPEGYIRLFVDEGAQLAALLREAQKRGSATDYAARLLAAFSDAEPRTYIEDTGVRLDAPSPAALHSASLVEMLNERELAVLRLIVAGRSNREIADTLVIALSTVKTHINNLYGKLGIHSRTQAVARARAFGLL